MQPSIHRQDGELNQASKLANNAISAIDAVKYFNGQDTEIAQYTKVVGKAARCYLVQARSIAVQIGLVRFVTLAMFVQGFWFGSHLVLMGSKNAGQVLTAFWACLIATQAVEQIMPQMMVLERGRTAVATLKSMLTQVENGRTTRRLVGRVRPGYCDGDIEIRNVSCLERFRRAFANSLGYLCLPFTAKSAYPYRRKLLLRRRRNYLCCWQKRLWEEYTGILAHEVLRAKVRRFTA